MKKKLTILLDCDGVLADFVGGYLKTVELFTGRRFAHDVVDKMDIGSCGFLAEAATEWGISSDPNLTLEQRMTSLRAAIDGEIATARWCAKLAPFAAAQRAVRALHIGGHNVYVVTSPWAKSPTWGYERTQWLEKHFGIARDHIILTKAKHLVRGDVFIDDDPEMVKRWSDAQPYHGLYHGFTSLLWDADYNQMKGSVPGGDRVYNWRDVINVCFHKANGTS